MDGERRKLDEADLWLARARMLLARFESITPHAAEARFARQVREALRDLAEELAWGPDAKRRQDEGREPWR